MDAINAYNGLHNKTVYRHELRRICNQAKKEKETEVVNKIAKLLRDNPDIKLFQIEIETPLKSISKSVKAPKKSVPKKATQKRPKNKRKPKTEKGLNGFNDPLFTLASDRTVRKTINTFRLPGEIGKLLGDLQAYMLAIVLTGDTHSGKSEVVKQTANAFLSLNKSVAFFDLEQGGMASKDTTQSIDRNISKENQKLLAVAGAAPHGIDTIKAYSDKFDVVIIDSFQKLKIPNTRFDELRQEFPNTIFIIIFQQNGEGGTRGGVSADFDAPVSLKVVKVDNTFKNNYTEVLKNRGNVVGYKYNHYSKKFLGFNEQPQ